MLFFSGEADLLGLKARIVVSLDVVPSFREVGVVDLGANLFFTVHSFGKIVVFDS